MSFNSVVYEYLAYHSCIFQFELIILDDLPPPKLLDLKLLPDDPRLLSVLPTLRELDGELNDRLGVGRVRGVLFNHNDA